LHYPSYELVERTETDAELLAYMNKRLSAG